MDRHDAQREAKEFLVSRIVREAAVEGVSLSDVERKMLYFSETAWTLPDIMEVNDVFDREYDPVKYEAKIARLIRNARKRARKEDEQDFDAWSDAIRTLSKEDHYLLIMVEQADASVRPSGDFLKLWGTGFTVVFVTLGAVAVLRSYFGESLTRDSVGFFGWVAAICVVGLYWLLFLVLGRQRMTEISKKLFRAFDRKK